MNLTRVLVCVAIMAGVTYLVRMLPLAIFRKKIRNRFVISFLSYVPYAVLAAMTLPDILYSTASMLSALAGLITAVLLAQRGKGLLTVALGAVAMVFLAERLLPLAGLLSM